MTERQPPNRPDDLKQRYLQASAAQNIGPSERVRQAALDHAQMMATAHAAAGESAPSKKAAANRWNFSLVASVAIAGISALLALQFDRGDPQDKEVISGRPSATAPVELAPAPPADLAASATEKSINKSVQRRADEAAQSRAPSPSPEAIRAAKASADSTAQAPLPAPARAANPATAKPAAAKDQPSEALARAVPPAEPALRIAKTDGESAADLSPENATTRPATSVTPAAPAAPATAPSRASARDGAQFNVPSGAEPEAATSRAAAASTLKSRSQTLPSAPTATSQAAETLNAAPAASPVASASAVLRNAARSGQIVVLDQALQQATPAQINATDDRGRTPLMLATLGGHIGAVQRLVTAGADATLKDLEGKTAAQMAQQSGATVIYNILKNQPATQ